MTGKQPTCDRCLFGSCLEPALPEAPLEAELSEDNIDTLSLKAESLSGLSVRAEIQEELKDLVRMRSIILK